MCSESANSAEALQWRHLVSNNISYKRPPANVKESFKKLILDLHLDPDRHQNLTTSRGSPLASVYHV